MYSDEHRVRLQVNGRRRSDAGLCLLFPGLHDHHHDHSIHAADYDIHIDHHYDDPRDDDVYHNDDEHEHDNLNYDDNDTDDHHDEHHHGVDDDHHLQHPDDDNDSSLDLDYNRGADNDDHAHDQHHHDDRPRFDAQPGGDGRGWNPDRYRRG